MSTDPVAGDVLGRRLGLPSLGRISTAASSSLRDRADQLGVVFQLDDVAFVQASISSAMAVYFSRSLRKITSG